MSVQDDGTSPATTPSQPTGSRAQTAVAKRKLRDCCLGCALSKVRCPREKPACSRCVKRKVTCKYLESKRAGRRHDTSDDTINHTSRVCSIFDLNLDDTGNFNATCPGSTALAATASDAVSSLQPTSSSWLAPDTTTTTAATRSLDTSFLLSPQELATDSSLESTTSAKDSQRSLNPLSPDTHESDSSRPTLLSLLTTDRLDNNLGLSDNFDSDTFETDPFDADILLSDTFDVGINPSNALDFGSSGSNDGIPSSLDLSPETLLKDNSSGLSNSLHLAAFSEAPISKPRSPISAGGDQIMTDSHCSCLTQALRLMSQLFPQPSTFCRTSGKSGSGDLLHLPMMTVVIERNRHAVEAVSAMLACPCSQDVHLLAIMAHIVFKVLKWYAVAARKTPLPLRSQTRAASPSSKGDGGISNHSSDSSNDSGSRNSPTGWPSTATSSPYSERVCWQAERVGRYRLDGDDSDRMAAQLVLSELHRVQSLVRELAAKLKAQASTEAPSVSSGGNTIEQPLLPFSSSVLDMLGVDLRKRLKELSVEIARSLKND